MVLRAIVIAEGCEIAETEPFTVLPGEKPIEITLTPSQAAPVMFTVSGLPTGKEREGNPSRFAQIPLPAGFMSMVTIDSD